MITVGAIPTPATINGLPFHPLIVHAVVVILPLTVLGAIGISVWPAMRRHLGLLVLLASVISVLLVPIATSSGEKFRDKLGPFIAKRIHTHQEYAGNLLPWAATLFVLVLLTMAVDVSRRLGPVLAEPSNSVTDEPLAGGGIAVATRPTATVTAPPMTRLDQAFGRLLPAGLRARTDLLRIAQPILGLLTVITALVLVWYVYKTGDSGAKVVWGTTG